MKRLLEVAGFLALMQGGMGLLHEFAHWDVGLLQRVGLLDGYEVYASGALIALACALWAVAGSRRPD